MNMMDEMMGGKMYHNPRMLLDKIIKSEEMEIPLYYELARNAPNEHLRRTIEYMAQQEKQEIEKLKMLYEYFPPYSGHTPMSRSESVHETSMYYSWLDGVKKARDAEICQCYMLCHLAMYAPYPHVHKMILDLAMEELQEAMFWNDIYIAYSGMPMPYPGPGYHAPGYGDPGYQGPGYGGMPGNYSQSEKKDDKK